MTLNALLSPYPPAVLVLADGSVFHGVAVGASTPTVGEVVFNTAMTGYQEVLTDPSYTGQIVTFTYPHIGNVGCNQNDVESQHVGAAGVIMRSCSDYTSNWRSQHHFVDWLKANAITAISEVDTRRLTHSLRRNGAQAGCIMAGNDVEAALEMARAFDGLESNNLTTRVTTKHPYQWTAGTDSLIPAMTSLERSLHLVVIDFGVKQQILRLFNDQGYRVSVLPAGSTYAEVMALAPDGVFLSNGPGDPAACADAIALAQELIHAAIPVFGICLGFQILALACGASTCKMKFGHHGANHPVQDVRTNKVFISSQNHSFSVDQATLPAALEVTHVSLFDGTLQGFRHKHSPVLAFQGHPEASPGPQDLLLLFDEFRTLMLTRLSVHATKN